MNVILIILECVKHAPKNVHYDKKIINKTKTLNMFCGGEGRIILQNILQN